MAINLEWSENRVESDNETLCLLHLQKALACLGEDDRYAVVAARIEHAIDDIERRLLTRDKTRPN